MMRQGSPWKALLALCQLLLLAKPSAAAHDAKSDRIVRMEFVRAMEEVEQENRRKESQESLQTRLLQVAREVLPGTFGSDERDLANQNNDDAYAQGDSYSNSGPDLSQYALKYVGCQNVHTWSDDLTGSSSPLMMNRFVMFRLCKAKDCSAYNKWGCSYNYGEYVLPMEDYLTIMAEYHFEQFGRFCQTCYRCMHMDYYSDDDVQAQVYYDDAVNATYDDAYNVTDDAYCDFQNGGDGCSDDAYWAEYRRYWGERKLNDNYYNNQGNGAKNYYYNNNGGGDDNYQYNNGDDDFYNNDVNNNPWYADQYGKCIFEDACSDYRKVCRKYNPEETFYESYFTCSVFNVGSSSGYVGPHCRSDGRTIGIGVYKDASCNEYIGNSVDIEALAFDDSEMENYYDKDCISCSAADSYSLITDDAITSGQDYTYPLCSIAYQVAGKCDRSMSSSFSSSSSSSQSQYESSENQEANEETVCNFIESLVERNYGETGEIVLRSSVFNMENWQHPGEYVKVVQEATMLQRLVLTGSAVLFFALLTYAGYLTKKLVYRKAWRPPHSVTSPYAGSTYMANASAVTEAGRLSRASSGIMALRSMSGDGASTFGGDVSTMAHSQIV